MRVTSVRRTVTVAVALVVGQALLCGIIGFVTFGGKSEVRPAPRAVEPRLAGPPRVVPPPGVPPPSSAAPTGKRTPVRATSTHRSLPAPPPARTRSRATSKPSRPPAVTPPSASSAPPAPAISPPVALLPTSPAAGDDESPDPPVAGQSCDDEDATGKTAEGKSVRCERDRDGDLRWRLV